MGSFIVTPEVPSQAHSASRNSGKINDFFSLKVWGPWHSRPLDFVHPRSRYIVVTPLLLRVYNAILNEHRKRAVLSRDIYIKYIYTHNIQYIYKYYDQLYNYTCINDQSICVSQYTYTTCMRIYHHFLQAEYVYIDTFYGISNMHD